MATIARIMHGDRAIFVHYNDSPNNMLPVLNELLARDGEEQVVRKLFAHRWWGYLATSGFHSLACDKLTVCINGYGGGGVPPRPGHPVFSLRLPHRGWAGCARAVGCAPGNKVGTTGWQRSSSTAPYLLCSLQFALRMS